MFQPQPTPFSPFASYGAQNGQGQDQDQNTYYSQTSGLRGLSGGPIVFDNPTFSPVGAGFAPQSSLPPNLDFPKHDLYGAMDAPPSDDLATQEALARGYQPESKVRSCGWIDIGHQAYMGCRVLWWGKRSQHWQLLRNTQRRIQHMLQRPR